MADAAADAAHVAQLHATAREVTELVTSLGARWTGYTVWRSGQPEVCIRLASAGELPGYLDAHRLQPSLVSGTDDLARWHVVLRNALITWPA